jgi:hypothetical protein
VQQVADWLVMLKEGRLLYDGSGPAAASRLRGRWGQCWESVAIEVPDLDRLSLAHLSSSSSRSGLLPDVPLVRPLPGG